MRIPLLDNGTCAAVRLCELSIVNLKPDSGIMLSQHESNRKLRNQAVHLHHNLKLDSSFIMLHTQTQWQGLHVPRSCGFANVSLDTNNGTRNQQAGADRL